MTPPDPRDALIAELERQLKEARGAAYLHLQRYADVVGERNATAARLVWAIQLLQAALTYDPMIDNYKLKELHKRFRDFLSEPPTAAEAECAALLRVAEAAERWDYEWSVAPWCNGVTDDWVSLERFKWREMLHGGREAVSDALAELRRAQNGGSDG